MSSSAASSPNLGLGSPSTFSSFDPQRTLSRGPSESAPASKDPVKIIVRFKATGNAPIMKQNLFKISSSHKFQAVHQFLRTQLNFKPADPLFLYINASFAPAPDELVSSLFASYGTEGQLIVNYSSTQAWG
ncbi:Atg12p [Sporobolomyces salmoneus]|uniref:Atg12p n=1 Tax=Sporobolomyces salmoneus TaxID=183962 RepID=UPI00317ED10E